MDQQQSTSAPDFRSQLKEWIKEIIPFSETKNYIYKSAEHFNTHDPSEEYVSLTFCTANHVYHIRATHTYLGATVTCNFWRPGESSHRGSDLPDGPFRRQTWENIKDALIRYELVKLTPLVPVTEIPEVSPRYELFPPVSGNRGQVQEGKQ